MARRMIFSLLLMTMACMGMAWPTPAQARAFVIRSDPPDGVQLGAAPSQVRLWLSQAVVVDPATVELVEADGSSMAPAHVHTTTYQPADVGLRDQFDATYLYLCSVGARTLPTLLTVDLPAVQAGTFTLRWQAIGVEDRHSINGSLVFAVQPNAANSVQSAAQSSTQQVKDLLVSLAVRPNTPGANFLDLQIVSTRRPAPAAIERVQVQLMSQQTPVGAPLVAQPLGNNRYQVASDALRTAGDWLVLVTIQRKGLDTTTVMLPWSVPAPQPAIDARLLGSSLACVLAAAIVMTSLMRRRKAIRQRALAPSAHMYH